MKRTLKKLFATAPVAATLGPANHGIRGRDCRRPDTAR